MVETKIRSIESSAQKTVEWIKDVQNLLEWEDEQHAYSATRAVLHAIRDRLPVDKAVKFADPFPMVLKGAYYEDYTAGEKPLKFHRDEFMAAIEKEMVHQDVNPEELLTAVVKMLKNRAPEDMKQLVNSMPKDLMPYF